MEEFNIKFRPKRYDEKKESGIFKRNQNITSYANASEITVALAQVKAGNTSENLLNEIHQIIYSLYGAMA